MSKAGIEDDLIRWEPRYVIIDEFHEMDERDYAPLRLYQDPEATLRIWKGNKDVEFPGDHPVFATANRVERKSPETLSRFWLFEFTGYSEDEYVEVCENLLPARYGVSEDLARFIGREVYRIGDVDVRDAERVAELVDSRDAAAEKIHLMGKYRGRDNTLF